MLTIGKELREQRKQRSVRDAAGTVGAVGAVGTAGNGRDRGYEQHHSGGGDGVDGGDGGEGKVERNGNPSLDVSLDPSLESSDQTGSESGSNGAPDDESSEYAWIVTRKDPLGGLRRGRGQGNGGNGGNGGNVGTGGELRESLLLNPSSGDGEDRTCNGATNGANGVDSAHDVHTITIVNGTQSQNGATRATCRFDQNGVDYSHDERSTPEYAMKFGGMPRKANGCIDRWMNGPTGRVPQDQLFWFKAHGPARLRTYFQVSMLLMAIYIGVFAVRSLMSSENTALGQCTRELDYWWIVLKHTRS